MNRQAEREARTVYSLECGHDVIPKGNHEISHTADGTKLVYCPNHEFSYKVVKEKPEPATRPPEPASTHAEWMATHFCKYHPDKHAVALYQGSHYASIVTSPIMESAENLELEG